ncbi:MAG: single-stranded DNA-binding protein [Cyanobacteria bacterium SZAS LIN-3]|nr:single-stranded DNA-binding protein [Cyanobacteria bacterium SZAS LIN-3]
MSQNLTVNLEVDDMSLANVSLVGNLVKAPEPIQFSSGRNKTTLVIAVNGVNHKQQSGAQSESQGINGKSNTADFYRVETWGKLAELAAKYLKKGNQVTVSGRLVMDHWTDKHGNNRITPVVEANQLSLPQKPKGQSASLVDETESFEDDIVGDALLAAS